MIIESGQNPGPECHHESESARLKKLRRALTPERRSATAADSESGPPGHGTEVVTVRRPADAGTAAGRAVTAQAPGPNLNPELFR
jgi:hypothetical protein